ncbi:hypothetical protein CLU96_1381 [Chryseobacterium sp. 52]|uniref:hypothetical protein n=1 Tax=Chryseobacterium sp. 52 TaxID=2035213 RepID=UPI000C189729|nr:hypothetical protein [Chryseobacterium sp. 52]PIF44413.1 hypothetical protein CLU96_1381 [Chryseobacterium sp. 52]
MDRNYKLLKFLFTYIVITVLISCFNNKEEENPLDLPNYNPTLNEAIGKYYFVPIKDEFSNRDDYKYFNLKKGDTSFLEIKKDSTYLFNRFYYNRENNSSFYSPARQKDNLHGKLVIEKKSIGLSPNLDVKNATIYLLGFKKSQKSGLYYYYGINSPTDPSYFEYYIMYKKIK